MKKRFLTYAFFLLLFLSCREKQAEPLIAEVGQLKISLRDFKERAELTIRPAALNTDPQSLKQITLNALIAEKLFALEAGHEAWITDNVKLGDYLTGIREQKMREMHYLTLAWDQVQADQELTAQIMAAAGRKFQLSYFDVPLTSEYDSLSRLLRRYPLEAVVGGVYPGRAPQLQEITWSEVLNTEMFDSLFARDVEPGQIIGPVLRQDGRVFFFRVDGWQNTINLSENEQATARRRIENMLRQQAAIEKYDQVIAGLMQGKDLEFDLDGLIPLVNLLGPLYLDDQTGNRLDENPAGKFTRPEKLDSLAQSEKTGRSVLKIDGQNWTIAEIFEAVNTHPLVFREKKFPRRKFGEQLKLALADLIRDHYITRDAYARGLDKDPEVIRTGQAWQDYLYSVLHREKMLQAKKDPAQPDLEFLDREVRRLREKYKPQIRINTELLARTELNQIPVLALQQNVPYPLVAPGFPQLTLNNQ